MKGRFYLIKSKQGVLYTNDSGIADYAVKDAGWTRVSSIAYGWARRQLRGKQKAARIR